MEKVTIEMDFRDALDMVGYLQTVQTMNRESLNVYAKMGLTAPILLTEEFERLDRIIDMVLRAVNKN